MDTDRISHVIEPGAARVVVFGPRFGDKVAALGEMVEVVSRFKPDVEAFEAAGQTVLQKPEGHYDLAIVVVPRSKLEARALIELAVRHATRVVVDGQKTDGIDSIARDIRKRAPSAQVVSKSHGKSVGFAGGDFADWADPGPLGAIDGFETRAGVFSADRVDVASAFLLEHLPAQLGPKVADLGAGWGYLSRGILGRAGVEVLHLIEADHTAFACARVNIDDTRARFHWADATKVTLPEPLDTVVMNPPFHVSRDGDPALGQAFIAAAARLLAPRGEVFLVANRHLPYEASLAAHFSENAQIAAANGFKILRAAKPLRRIDARS